MKKQPKTGFINNKGFTLIEVIAVLVILGILSVVAVSKISINNTDIISIESALKTHLRYAQAKAMQSDIRVWGLRIDTNLDEYWLFQSSVGTSCAWAANRMLPPGAETSPANFNQDRLKTSLVNVDIDHLFVQGASKSQVTLVYDEFGVPFWLENATITFMTPLSNTPGLNRLMADLTLGLTDHTGNNKTITLSSETGFVQ